MKVLDTEKPVEKPVKADNSVNLTKYRKKKKFGKHLFKIIVILLGITAFILVWVNAETIFEPLRGVASRIETKTSYNVGFPIELPGSSDYSLKKMGENFMLLTDTYLYTYDTSGAQMYALKHGYSNPHQVTNDKRVLLYDKSGYKFAVYSKSSRLYEKTTDDKILYTSVGSENLYAVVTDSKRYSNVLYIYDDGGNWKYTRKFADENIMQVCFTGDGEHIAVSTISSAHGDIITNFYEFSIKSQEGSIWKYSTDSGSIPCGMFADRQNITAVCDNAVLSLTTITGELNGRYEYKGVLKHFDITADKCVLHYHDVSSNTNVLTVLNKKAEAVAAVTVRANTSCIRADEDGVCVLEGTHFVMFDGDLLDSTDMTLANEGYTEFVKIGRSIFMLGYDAINKTDLPEQQKQ